jgi:hypothetical protein
VARLAARLGAGCALIGAGLVQRLTARPRSCGIFCRA